jgi:general secretion pathway protein G
MKKSRRHSHDPARDSQSGITLIELLVVMVIISLFATLVGTRVMGRVDQARQTTASSQIAQYSSALDLFRLDVGRYPTQAEGLQALRTAPGGLDRWDGPYVQRDIGDDPWGNPYVYRIPGEHGDFDLLSWGADGAAGGEDDNQDIVSWQ